MEEPTHLPETVEEYIRNNFVYKPFKPFTYQVRSGDPDRNIEFATAERSDIFSKHIDTYLGITIMMANHIEKPNKMVGFHLKYQRTSHFDEKYLPKLLLITFAHVFIRHAIWNKKAFSCIKVYAKCFWFSLRHPWVIQKN